MLIVTSVSRHVVPYFTDGRHPGRWSGAAAELLGLRGPVAPADLRAALEGCDPATGEYLPRRRPHRRRAGWDLVFGAPKSISMLGASHGGESGRSVSEAHAEAVAGVVGFIEDRLTVARTGADGKRLRAEGLLAAAFDHTTNAAGEPHLHTHLLVANLSRAGGEWGAVRGTEWFVGRAALASLYQLELRHQLHRRGWQLDWRLRPDGLADLADVPRTAVRAASSQSRVAASAGRFAARRSADRPPWEPRVTQAGYEATQRVSPPRASTSSLDDPALARAVTIRLAERRSDFRSADVIVALAGCHPGGASARHAADWADRFCARSHRVPSPTEAPRWTTEAARRSDDQLRRQLGSRSCPPVADRLVEEARSARAALGEPAWDVVRALTTSAAGAHFLYAEAGRTDLLAQAEVLLACREMWERSGRRVAVSSPTAEAARRWQVLAGLVPYRPGDRPDVLVVDQADRRTSAELARLARQSGASLVFVEGGTLPRLTNPASHGLRDMAAQMGRHVCPPHRPWAASERPAVNHDGGGAGGGARVGRAAAADLLSRWQGAGDGPLLVALGLEEVRELNRAARAMRLEAHSPGLQAGDRVVVLGRRAGLPGYGVFGTVTSAPAAGSGRRAGVGIAWDDGGRTRTADAWLLGAVGYGYAVTPAVAARTRRPLMVLGPASSLGRGRERVVAETGPGLDRPDGRRIGLER